MNKISWRTVSALFYKNEPVWRGMQKVLCRYVRQGIDRATCFVREHAIHAKLVHSVDSHNPRYCAHAYPTVTMKKRLR